MKRDLRSIRQRWRGPSAVRNWRQVRPDVRAQVLGDLEDMQREATSSGRLEEASALQVAVDLLELLSMNGALATWDEATEDVEWLLRLVDQGKQGT